MVLNGRWIVAKTRYIALVKDKYDDRIRLIIKAKNPDKLLRKMWKYAIHNWYRALEDLEEIEKTDGVFERYPSYETYMTQGFILHMYLQDEASMKQIVYIFNQHADQVIEDLDDYLEIW